MSEENQKSELPIDWILIVGLMCYAAYAITNGFVALPDIAAYPWLIVSAVLLVFGVYRTIKKTVSRRE